MYMVMSLRHTELIVRRPIGSTRTYKQTKGTQKKLENVIFACRLKALVSLDGSWMVFLEDLLH
jgi:hypothetical protein